jgi:hypothetical protein
MSIKPDRLRQCAANYLRLARGTDKPEIRTLLIRMAETLRTIAREAELRQAENCDGMRQVAEHAPPTKAGRNCAGWPRHDSATRPGKRNGFAEPRSH